MHLTKSLRLCQAPLHPNVLSVIVGSVAWAALGSGLSNPLAGGAGGEFRIAENFLRPRRRRRSTFTPAPAGCPA
jgi:hypothetical protein